MSPFVFAVSGSMCRMSSWHATVEALNMPLWAGQINHNTERRAKGLVGLASTTEPTC